MKDLHIAALHPNSKPFSCGTVAQRKDLDKGEELGLKFLFVIYALTFNTEQMGGGN